MYVPKMSEAEVLMEHLRDALWLCKTHVKWSHPNNLRIAAKCRKQGLKKLSELHYEYTKQGNRVMLLRTVDVVEKSVDLMHISIIPCEDNTIMYGVLFGEREMMFFTPHFFDRYKERMEESGFTIRNPVRSYFLRNPFHAYESGAHPKYENDVQFAVNDGIMLGDYRGEVTIHLGEHDEVWHLFDSRTFLIKGGNHAERIKFVDNIARAKL